MSTSSFQLQKGEQVIAIIRRHWFRLAVVGFIDGCVVALLLIGLVVLDTFVLSEVTAAGGLGQLLPLSLFVLAGSSLILWMHFFSVWSDHWLDAWIITNKRIIDIEQKGFFQREVSSIPLSRIQDMTVTTEGIIAMWLHFGDVRIQTASITRDLIMRQVPFPEDVREHVLSVLALHNTVTLS